MNLTLLAVSLNEQPLAPPIAARFDDQGGTIGREDHNTMALPDPERHVSRVQAEVLQRRGVFAIRNVSATNPIMVAGRMLPPGDMTPLVHGEQIRVGGYLLLVQCQGGGDDGTTRVGAPPPAALVLPARAAGAAASADNPFADLLDNGGPRRDALPSSTGPAGEPIDVFGGLLPPPAGVHPESAALAAPVPTPPPRLPADFNPFAAPRATASRSANPFADLDSEALPPSIDADFGLGTPAAADALARFTGDTGATQPPAVPTQADDLPAIHAAFTPPRVDASLAAASLPSAPPPPEPAAASDSRPPLQVAADAALSWRAFCDGAGIELPLAPNEVPERLRLVGRILNSAIAGVLQLVSVRASTKYEMRADVTMIQQRGNNPLKFAPDARSGIEQLVQPPARGFLDGGAAMDDAMHDLVGHSIGTVAGMRAAIDGMLDRFDPRELEARVQAGSALDRWWPMRRKARLWESYRQHHLAVRDQAREDFHALFGRAFLAAYEQQVERLERRAEPR